ncbi:MAG: response regulator [Chitinophagaceae bacterium]|nr:response regulator [Chitinophagaceae bacterium]
MKTILLIDDNEDIRNNTAEILQLSNYRVLTAENGMKGLELAIAEQPDLIICDIMMPELDGFGVLHAIHNNEKLTNTPFIFLTAKAERSDFRKGMEQGADDYITKPFSGTELLNAVESRIKKNVLLKQDIAPGMEGVHHLMNISSGKSSIQKITEDRNINRYKKKQIVYTEGNHPNRLFFVLKGKVKAYKTNDEGKELVTELYRPGDFLGHIALLEGSVYHDTAAAMEDTELAIIPREEFDELMHTNPELSQKFIQLLANNVSSLEDKLVGLAYDSLRKKVANALIVLQKKYQDAGETSFVIDINRESLATIAGTAKESLIRTLSDFKTEKLVDIAEGKITILNLKKLENMVN